VSDKGKKAFEFIDENGVVPGFGYESGTRKEISKQRQPNVRRKPAKSGWVISLRGTRK
jgi:hypothetical protein